MVDLSVNLDEGRLQTFHQALLNQAASEDEAVEAFWRQQDRRRERARKEENRQQWVDYYKRLSVAFRHIAEEHEARAEQLLAKGISR